MVENATEKEEEDQLREEMKTEEGRLTEERKTIEDRLREKRLFWGRAAETVEEDGGKKKREKKITFYMGQSGVFEKALCKCNDTIATTTMSVMSDVVNWVFSLIGWMVFGVKWQ
ncbi:Uncharacterized protein TCM_002127 [Theobroma cacao]|uniref:Uncharacterized protein n=1 Tax=Theobroma cacao TaxID=3641 RepID=A0A061DKS8_THECC|nr:Uncharacterized protein TCM_002127 [Theobroma cacao]